MRSTGRSERTTTAGEAVSAFVPIALPPRDPPLVIEGALRERLTRAEQALARLDLAGAMVPSVDWFIYGFVRKEAVVSSQIEGTQATLLDLLTFEAQTGDTKPSADVEELSNYVDAVRYARRQLHDKKGLPLSMRLLNETHRRLMRGVRGQDKNPGEPRRTQNWIGGSRPGNAVYVPPPPHLLPELLSDFEKYIHVEGDPLPPLVRAGLLHAQFETIHPYLDGNGRIGRLLVALVIEDSGLLSQPLLYSSLFFKRHRDDYYRRLNAVRSEGDWEGWTEFFLDGVATVAEEGVASARELFARVGKDRERVLADATASIAGLRLFEQLPKKPIVTVAAVMALLKTTKPRAGRAVDGLVKARVLVEITGKKRDRVYAYRAYLDLLRVGTELDMSLVR